MFDMWLIVNLCCIFRWHQALLVFGPWPFLVFRHLFDLLGSYQPFLTTFVTLWPFCLFLLFEENTEQMCQRCFCYQVQKHTVADVGHSNNKAVKKNGKKCQRVLQSVSDDDGTPYVRHCKFVGLVTGTELENVYMCMWRNFLN